MNNSNTTLTILRRAREILTPPGAWTQGEAARDSEGELVAAADPAAVCWCSIGALIKATPDDEMLRARASAVLKRHVPAGLLVTYNDYTYRTQAEVLAVFDKAIASLEAPQ